MLCGGEAPVGRILRAVLQGKDLDMNHGSYLFCPTRGSESFGASGQEGCVIRATVLAHLTGVRLTCHSS